MHNRFIPAALAAVALTLTACGTTTGEPTAAPSTSTFANAADADRAARARAALPNSGGITLEDAEAARQAGLPFVFGAGGRDCPWIRFPDDSLYALHSTGHSHRQRGSRP